MKYCDYISGFDKGDNIVYVPAQIVEYERNIVIFTHTLIKGGSQYALEMLIPLLNQMGYGIFVVSFGDGMYRDIFLEKFNSTVVIQPSLIKNKEYVTFLRESFSYVILNSVSGKNLLYFYNSNTKVYWWMHETIETIEYNANENGFIPDILGDNFNYLTPWPKTLDEFNQVYNRKMQLLPIAVEDFFVDCHNNNDSGIVKFLIPGSYSIGKGFHNAILSILNLPSEIVNKAQFYFVGNTADQEIHDLIQETSITFPQVKVIEEVCKEEMHQLYQNTDCVIVPSLMDSGPLTVVEALMHQKLCILSDNCGVHKQLHNGEDCLIFETNNTTELADDIIFAINNRSVANEIALKGRETYLKIFSKDAVREILANLFV